MTTINISQSETKRPSVKKGTHSTINYAQYTNAGGGGSPLSDWDVANSPDSVGRVRVTYLGDDAPGTQVQLTISVDNDPRCVDFNIV